jgi:predicted peptidase
VKKWTGALIVLAVLLFSQCAAGPGSSGTQPTARGTVKTGQHPQESNVSFRLPDGSSHALQIKYLLYLPEAYGRDPQKKWPLILFLHGRGERGNDLQLLTRHPLPEMLVDNTSFPFVVVSPQLSLESGGWQDTVDALDAFLDTIQGMYSVDASRVYVTGLSMGGFGTWQLAMKHPRRFAAIAPIAGGYYYRSKAVPSKICALASVPVWAFHGALDTVVEPWQSQVLVDALKKCGGEVRFTLYENADHEAAWQLAYGDPELFRWLLSHRLSR